jgi:alkaline phosphatase
MKKLITVTTFFLFLFTCTITNAQPKAFSVANAHAHNDYLHPIPFYTAYNAGFGSIEVDIFPVNGILLVAHSKKEIMLQNTLKTLYLDPLLKELQANNFHQLKLLVDIKENYKLSLDLLIKELNPFNQYLATPQNIKPLMIIISGDRPTPSEYKNYPAYIFFDENFILKHTPEEWKRVGLISRPFNKISKWKGEDVINPKDKKRIKGMIDSVHNAGKPFRFWAAPDNKTSWKLQKKLHADLIGTDKIDELANYLR